MAEATESKIDRAMRIARSAKDKAAANVAREKDKFADPVAATEAAKIVFTKGDGVDAIPAAQKSAPGEEKQKPDGHSPKSKASRGIDPSLVTSWVDANFSPDAHLRMQKVAKQRNVKLATLLQTVLIEQLAKMAPEFDRDVAAYEEAQASNPTTAEAKLDAKLAKMTPEQLEAFAAAELKKYEDMLNEIAKRKAK